MEFDKVVKERCSIRSFQPKKVEKEVLDKILEAGRLAPTAKNLQPFKVYVIENNDYLEKIRECSPCTYNSETVLLICGNKDEAFHKEDYTTSEMDATIAATHMMLKAADEKVDSVWVEMFDKDKIISLFPLDEGYEPICLLPLGYRTSDATISQNHYNRKPIEELVTRL